VKVPTKSPTIKNNAHRSWGQLLKQKKLLEPTIGLEPMTCRLRIDCSTN
jgi:hypothetical protein